MSSKPDENGLNSNIESLMIKSKTRSGYVVVEGLRSIMGRVETSLSHPTRGSAPRLSRAYVPHITHMMLSWSAV